MHIGLSVQTKGQRLKTIVLYTKRRFNCKKEALHDNLTGYVWSRHTKWERFSYSAPINQSPGFSMYTRQIFRRATSVVSVINISIGRSFLCPCIHFTDFYPIRRVSEVFLWFSQLLANKKKKIHAQKTASSWRKEQYSLYIYFIEKYAKRKYTSIH